MTLPIFATVVGGLVLGWRRHDGGRRRSEPVRFLSTVSHELRTPLNAIVGWVNLLKSGGLTAAETARALDRIERNLRLEARLIDQLLDASSLLGGRLAMARAPVDLQTAVEAARARVADVAREHGVTITVSSLTSSPVVVVGDQSRLTEVFWHLLANAIKFSGCGSDIQVSIDTAGDSACVRVGDQGEGIAADELPRVFEPFAQGRTRARRTGLGLGLAIARELVRLHGGTISAHSGGEGRGAVFRVSLPGVSSRSDSRETTAR